jgi:hypothetical protein
MGSEPIPPPPILRGITGTEIRSGQTMPYTARCRRAFGKGEVGYFKMINKRRHQRPQGQSDFAGQLRADGGADAAAGGARRGLIFSSIGVDVRHGFEFSPRI